MLIALELIRFTAVVVNLRGMKKKMESSYDLDIVSNLEQFKFTDALTDNCWGSNHVFQFCLEPVGDTSTRRPGKR